MLRGIPAPPSPDARILKLGYMSPTIVPGKFTIAFPVAIRTKFVQHPSLLSRWDKTVVLYEAELGTPVETSKQNLLNADNGVHSESLSLATPDNEHVTTHAASDVKDPENIEDEKLAKFALGSQ